MNETAPKPASAAPSVDWPARLRRVTLDLHEKDQLSPHSRRDAATRPMSSALEREERQKEREERQKAMEDSATGEKHRASPPLEAAVLVPLLTRSPGDYTILLTRRSAELKSHRGQIAFPGGKIDTADASPQAAAIRETGEEIGIPTSQIDILGKLPLYQTGTGFIISPIVGQLAPPYIFRAEQGEVAEIFEVPLAHILDEDNFQRQSVMFEGKAREFWAVPYQGYYIWGATAAILKELAERLAIAE